MPTYEFKCPEGHLFEIFFPSISDQRRAKCPKCGKQAQRLISGGAGVLFKGSGFYATDYKKSGQKSESQEADTKPAESAKPDKKKKDSSNSDK